MAWWDEQQLDSRGPDLVFQHVIMPHEPWTTAPDGRSYRATLPPTGYFANSWSSTGIEVARQRHVLNLQAADRLLGHRRTRRTVVVDELEEIEGSTPDRPYAEVVGGAELPVGTIVAYALNGTIVAVTAAEDRDGAVELVHGLVPPDRFREGGNVLSAYEVTGPVGGETLLPLTVRSDG